MKIESVGTNYAGSRIKTNRNKFAAKQPSFGRDWKIHTSWGAVFKNETGKTNFKLFTFPNTHAVFVEIADKVAIGASNIKERAVQLLGIAAASYTITKGIPVDKISKVYPMENKGDGIFVAEGIDAKPDDKYRYIIVTENKEVNLVKDPYAKKQDSIHGWSSIYNPDNYEWKNTDWLEGKDSRRIKRNPGDERYRGLAKLKIEEINIPSVTQEGTFLSAKKAVDKIADTGLANAIEIMPVENTYSKQWGYDGVDKFAINRHLGTAAELKELIDYAHGKGLNVIMDMVPNHMGTDGDYLSEAGPYEAGSGQFGALLNFEHPNNRYVRDWMANAALWWANEFKVDGIRFDMTKEAKSDYLLKQMVDELNEHNPDVFLIAEDGRDNKVTITRYDTSNKTHEEKINETDMLVDLIVSGTHTIPHDVGYDSEWDFPFMHALADAIKNNSQASLNFIDDTMLNSGYRIKYVMSHDEIGNEDGTRLLPKIYAQHMNFFAKMDGSLPADVRGQNAAKLSHEIIKSLMMNINITDEELKEIQQDFGITEPADKQTLVNYLKASHAKTKLASGALMTCPGPKMFFQGEDYADLSYHKFFRDFSPEFENYEPNKGQTENICREKGYNISNKFALKDSILGKYKPSGEFASMQKQLLAFNKDLFKITDENEPFVDGEIHSIYKDHENLVHIHSVEKNGEKFLVIKNFADKFHNGTYSSPGFPHNEKYVEILNSDDEIYGGGGSCNKDRVINVDNQALNLAANSISILKKID